MELITSNKSTQFYKGQTPHNKISFSEEQIKEIIRLYDEERYSHVKIAKIYRVNASTIGDLLKRLGKASRKSGEGKRSKESVKPLIEEIRSKYEFERLSVKKLSGKYGVAQATIKKWIFDYGLESVYRGFGPRKLPKDFVKPSKKELERLHHLEKNSINNIAWKFNISKTSVMRWFKEYGIINKLYTKNSNIELIMRYLLEKNNLTGGLEEQYKISLKKDYTRADFAYPKHKLAIYCDGDYWHGNWHAIGKNKENIPDGPRKNQIFEKTLIKDGKIHFELMEKGWTVLRFNERDINKQRPEIIDVIRQNLFDKAFIEKRAKDQKIALEIRRLQGIDI